MSDSSNEVVSTKNAGWLHGTSPVSLKRADYEVTEQSYAGNAVDFEVRIDVWWERRSFFFSITLADPVVFVAIDSIEMMSADVPEAIIRIATVVNRKPPVDSDDWLRSPRPSA